MGTWDIGHFDNDTAADFADGLDGAAPGERAALLLVALRSAAGAGEYLEYDEGVEAVAAAALVAAQCPGGAPVDSAYGPREAIPVPAAELRALAVEALDRVAAEESELAELWDEAADGEAWRRALRALRDVLEPVPPTTDVPLFEL
ncbi:DUF4259 domain-containing protein [Kitasatospora sp. Ki12]